MAITRESDVHIRRRGRNFAVLGLLLAFMVVVFAVTVVKIRSGGLLEGFDHAPRTSALPAAEAAE